MSDPNKTVFISYRRDVSKYLALAISKDLEHNNYDTFLDIENIDSGNWETVILNQIAARTHFVLLLTPGTLDRCGETNDVLRQEIEQAMRLNRNIVLVLADNFDFKSAQKFLTGRLSQLDKYNGFPFYYEYFDAGMSRLRERFLKAPDHNPILMPPPANDMSYVKQMMTQMTIQPAPTHEDLSAEQLFFVAHDKAQIGNFNDAIKNYTQAIKIKPDYVIAYFNRGLAHRRQGNFDDAIKDYTEAINLKPEYVAAYNNRAIAYRHQGNFTDAIKDYTQAIKIKSNYRLGYRNRGEVYFILHQFNDALNDFKKAYELSPSENSAIAGLAITYHILGNVSEAHHLWKVLIGANIRFKNIDWVKQELNWHEALAEQAGKLVAEL